LYRERPEGSSKKIKQDIFSLLFSYFLLLERKPNITLIT